CLGLSSRRLLARAGHGFAGRAVPRHRPLPFRHRRSGAALSPAVQMHAVGLFVLPRRRVIRGALGLRALQRARANQTPAPRHREAGADFKHAIREGNDAQLTLSVAVEARRPLTGRTTTLVPTWTRLVR